MYKIASEQDYEKRLGHMVLAVEDLLKTERNLTANLANISAFINEYMDRLNWVGFYLMEEGELVLGPFQGKPACIRIKLGKGVCGTVAREKEGRIVDDVLSFPGHIACDSDSRSELVLPICKNGDIFGVLDLDSPEPSRFTDLDMRYLKKITALLEYYLN